MSSLLLLLCLERKLSQALGSSHIAHAENAGKEVGTGRVPADLHSMLQLLFLLLQIWRLITNFLFFGPLGFSFFFNMIFLYPLYFFKNIALIVSDCLEVHAGCLLSLLLKGALSI